MIIKSTSAISASFYKRMRFGVFFALICIVYIYTVNIQVSRITVIIDWLNCLVINENFISSINACNVASTLNNPLCSRAWKSLPMKKSTLGRKKC